MKNYIPIYIVLFVFLSFKGLGQNQEIVSETNEFDYLIGMEYSEVSELDGLVYNTRMSMKKDDIETSSTNFTKGMYQIITSESVRHDPTSHKSVYKIQDVIILNGSYASCEGCLLSKVKDHTIKSIHPTGVKKRGSVLLAFEKNNLTGIYTQVDPSKYTWNQKTDRLEQF